MDHSRFYFHAAEHEIIHNDVYNSLFFGAIAGIMAKSVIAPGERVKMIFQISSEKFTIRKAMRKASSIICENGLLSLWRGHSATVVRVAPFAALSYTMHDYLEHTFQRLTGASSLPFYLLFLAGS